MSVARGGKSRREWGGERREEEEGVWLVDSPLRGEDRTRCFMASWNL